MAFSGIDDLVSEMGAGKYIKQPFSRILDTGATTAAGRWHSCITTGGTGGAMTVTGSAGVGVAFSSSTVGALPINAAVATDTRHLLTLLGFTSATTITPAVLLLTDIIHVYPSCVLTGSPTALSGHPVWTGTGSTRMTNPNGVQASVLVTTATTAGNGQITLNYRDQGGLDQSQVGSLYAVSTTHPAGCFYAAANSAVSLGGLYMQTAAGDRGVDRINSYTINTGATTGVGAFILHRPIASIPLNAVNLVTERNFIQDAIALPRIYDDSCLALFVMTGGSTTTNQIIQGELSYAWG